MYRFNILCGSLILLFIGYFIGATQFSLSAPKGEFDGKVMTPEKVQKHSRDTFTCSVLREEDTGMIRQILIYDKDSIRWQLEFFKGQLTNMYTYHGNSRTYERVGWFLAQKSNSAYFLNGAEHGKYEEYYSNGNIHVEGNYNGDIPDSMKVYSMYMWPGDIPQFDSKLGSGGLRNGKWTFWYENGKLRQEEFYHNNKKVKTWKYYDETGKLIKVEKYDNE